jgi:hypothetical protein
MSIELQTKITDILNSDNRIPEYMMDEYVPEQTRTLFANEGISINLVDTYGGEDQGSDYWSVWKFIKDSDTVLIKFYGFYASHYGTDYLGFKIVTPQQKTITVYE